MINLSFFLLLTVNSFINIVSGISCYKCSSINGSNPACEDPFHGDIAGQTSFLHTPCLTSLRDRRGVFPATHCIKLVAHTRESNPVRYLYRTCSRDDGDDNGITRTSHCGFLRLDWIHSNRQLRGCLHICERDSCNQAYYRSFSKWSLMLCLTLFVLIQYITVRLNI